MTWQSVGTHTFVPTDKAVQVGSFDLAAGQDTIWVKITQLNNPGDWPWSYGILSWRNADGTPLGSIKAYSNRLGEVFRLGNGLAPLDGIGSIWFEPRGFNLGWLKAGFPWELQFEAQAGASDLTSGYWNRDPVNGVISPRTPGDDVDLGQGNLAGNDGTFASALTALTCTLLDSSPASSDVAFSVTSGGIDQMHILKNGEVRISPDPSTQNNTSFAPNGYAVFNRSGDTGYGGLYFNSAQRPLQIFNNNGTVTWWVGYDGIVHLRSLVIDLEPDLPANYAKRMISGSEEEVYVGPVMDIQQAIAELDARIKKLESLQPPGRHI